VLKNLQANTAKLRRSSYVEYNSSLLNNKGPDGL